MALDRRSFITFVVGGAAGTLFTPVPWKLTDDVSIWTQNWPWIPSLEYGEIINKKTVCKLCPAGCGLEIVTVAGRPVTAKGDPEHPLSRGGICPLGAASVQLLYSPSRVKGPLRRTTGHEFEQITWEQAGEILAERLAGLKGGNSLAVLSGDQNGTINDLLAGFTASMGSSHFYQMPDDGQSCAMAWNTMMNGKGQVGYDLENSDYILMLGADAVSNWGTVVRNQKALSSLEGRSVYAGPVQSGTAAATDAWIPMKPGQEEIFALGIAWQLITEGLGVGLGSNFSSIRSNIVNNYNPAKVSEATGISPEVIRSTARELVRASRPLVITGSDLDQGAGPMTWAAGILVNMLLGNLNRKGGMKILPEAPATAASAPNKAEIASRSFVKFVQQVEQGQNVPEAILFYQANPAYSTPGAEKAAQALASIPFKVSFSTFMDETAALCDLVLPNPHYLERLDDSYSPFGSGQVIYSAGSPVLDPLFDTRPTGEIIMDLCKAMDIDTGYKSLEKMMQAKAESLGGKWRSIAGGQAYTSDDTVFQYEVRLPRELGAAALDSQDSQKLSLAPMARMRFGNGLIAIPPFATVTIRETELSARGFFVQINSATAFKHNLKQDQSVTLTSDAGSIQALVNINEGVMDDVVAVPAGFGHTAWDKFSRGKGDNVFKLLSAAREKGSDALIWNRTRVDIA